MSKAREGPRPGDSKCKKSRDQHNPVLHSASKIHKAIWNVVENMQRFYCLITMTYVVITPRRADNQVPKAQNQPFQ